MADAPVAREIEMPHTSHTVEQALTALRLHVGETYRLHLSSLDLQHGFSLQPLNKQQVALITKYDTTKYLPGASPGAIPFLDMGNRFFVAGAKDGRSRPAAPAASAAMRPPRVPAMNAP